MRGGRADRPLSHLFSSKSHMFRCPDDIDALFVPMQCQRLIAESPQVAQLFNQEQIAMAFVPIGGIGVVQRA